MMLNNNEDEGQGITIKNLTGHFFSFVFGAVIASIFFFGYVNDELRDGHDCYTEVYGSCRAICKIIDRYIQD
ncbi:hypothetical protein K7H94_22665 (plasmid) [Pantoea dispersa]|uniref:hypothetical protein n=1 Tax=Pantoea dispersa TaxID=59814 RepID=UPI001CA6EB66|nr:hypothetical protein [Pantoea dispersa]QZY92942.1 hypothetical protein K7H94_22665 [Pantoea dispersa]